MSDKPKLNSAQQLALVAAKVRKARAGQIEGNVANVFPQLKARAEAVAAEGNVNMIISSLTDQNLFQAINNEKGLAALRDNGFTVNVTTLNGAWVLDIYWDSGDPSRQTADTTTV